MISKPRNILLLLTVFFLAMGCDKSKSNVDEGENVIEDDETQYSEQEIAEKPTWDEVKINNFMQEAAMVDKMQIRIAELVKKRSDKEAITGYAEQLRTDHNHSLEELKKIATRENLNIIDSLDADHREQLRQLENTDTEFDRQFLEMMVKAHKKDIDKYKNAMQNIPYTHPVKDWIDDVVPVLQQHLFRAERLLDDKTIFPVQE